MERRTRDGCRLTNSSRSGKGGICCLGIGLIHSFLSQLNYFLRGLTAIEPNLSMESSEFVLKEKSYMEVMSSPLPLLP